MHFTISIIVRPNVGKSTLFNRLTGKRHALVHDLPGVTRDRREGEGALADLGFKIIDTAGLEEAKEDKLESRMMKQTGLAVEDSDLCLLMIDGRAGITPEDKYFAKWARKKDKPLILLVNKCEGSQGDSGFYESLKLGFNDIVAISAEHNEGMAELYQAIAKYYQKQEKEQEGKEDEENKLLQLAIVGRPNTGKSTLTNQLIGKERVLTGPEAGITRDSIAIEWQYKDKQIKLIDTAGIRKKAKVQNKLEKLSVTDTKRAIQYAHVVILMIDATQPLEKQDLSIADMVIQEGRALIIAANKWDLLENEGIQKEEIDYLANKLLPQIRGVPVVPISALEGNNLDEVIEQCLEVYKYWNKRITTTKLNQWLKKAESIHMPPLGKNNKRIKLKYITQGKKRPPTFMLFTNLPNDLPESYTRYLVNSMREEFNIPAVPIRLLLKKGDNPYQ